MSTVDCNLRLESLLEADAQLHLQLGTVPVANPEPHEVVIRVEAAPINPSDLGAMMGPADISTMRADGDGDRRRVTLSVPPEAMPVLSDRIGQPVPAGIEGAGIVVSAGSSPEAQALLGKVVAASTGAMYAHYRVAGAGEVLVLRDGTTPREAASSFINPMTALGMVETMRRESHTALVHTAAASSLGQMLNRICLVDDIPLVNVVRSDAQVALLTDSGAPWVLNATSPTFPEELTTAIAETGATLCFDLIGGGKLASQILTAMEAVQVAKLSGYQRYGSTVHKQLYISGHLDPNPTEVTHTFGAAWGISGWLLPIFLSQIEPEAVKRLKQRVADELTTTFASRYTRTISLHEALDPEILAACNRRATGEKYLIAPHM